MFPHIFTEDFKLPISYITGQLTIDTGTKIKLEDAPFHTEDFALVDRQFVLEASKIYHLRFSLTGEDFNDYTPSAPRVFYLIDVTDIDYNPSSLPEYDSSFDTTRKDVKLAVVITDGSADISDLIQYEIIGISKLSLLELVLKIKGVNGASSDDLIYLLLQHAGLYDDIDYQTFDQARTLIRGGDPLPLYNGFKGAYEFEKGSIGTTLKTTARYIVSQGVSDNIVDMTSNLLPYGEVIASTENTGSDHYGYRAVDDDDNTYWETTESTGTWEYDFSIGLEPGYYPKIISKIAVKITSDTDNTPKNMNLEYYDNGLGEWVVYRTFVDITWAADEKKYFETNHVIEADRYRLNITANNGGLILQIAEIEFIEPTIGVPDRFFFHAEYTNGVVIPINEVPVMYANSTPDGDSSASTEQGANEAWKSFDNDDATMWEATALTGWLEFEWPEQVLIKEFSLIARDDGNHATGSPGDFYFEGYNEDTTSWDILKDISGETWSAINERKDYAIDDNNRYYSRYRIDVTASSGATNIALAGFEMFRGVIPKLTFQYSVDDGTTYYHLPEDSDILVPGGFEEVIVKVVGEDPADLTSFGILYNYNISKSLTQLYEVYTEATGQTAPFILPVPNGNKYTADDQSLLVTIVKNVATTKDTYTGVRAVHFNEENSQSIEMLVDLAIGDIVVFWQKFGAYDISVDNYVTLAKEHDTTTGEHKLPDLNVSGHFGHMYYRDGEFYFDDVTS